MKTFEIRILLGNGYRDIDLLADNYWVMANIVYFKRNGQDAPIAFFPLKNIIYCKEKE